MKSAAWVLSACLYAMPHVSDAAIDMPTAVPVATACNRLEPPRVPGWPERPVQGRYFVDNSDPAATDDNNPYGSFARPRRSMPTGELAAGAVVELHGGPYEGSDIRIIARGDQDNPVWIYGAVPENGVVVRSHLLIHGSGVVIENLKFDRSRKTLALVSVESACIRNNEFSGSGIDDGNSAVIFIGGVDADHPSRDNVIHNNVIRNFGARNSSRENDYHGILPGRHSIRTWITDNDISGNGGDAIQVGQSRLAAGERPQHVYIARNRLYDNRENGVDIKRAQDVLVVANELHGYRPTPSSEGAAIVIHDDAEHVWIIGNRVSDATIGLITTGSKDTWFVGNTIHDIVHARAEWDPESAYAGGAAMHFRGNSDGGAIGNTIAFVDIGLQLTQGNATGYVVQNNIFALRQAPGGVDINVASGDFLRNTKISHNLFFGGDATFRVLFRGRSYGSLAGARRASGQFVASLLADPSFEDSGRRNFNVLDGSPVEGAGSPLEIAGRYNARYGASLYRTGKKSDGSRMDIGAAWPDPHHPALRRTP